MNNHLTKNERKADTSLQKTLKTLIFFYSRVQSNFIFMYMCFKHNPFQLEKISCGLTCLSE